MRCAALMRMDIKAQVHVIQFYFRTKWVGDVTVVLQKTRGMSTTEKSLRFLVTLGNYFGLLPVSGVMSQEGLSFSWNSLKVVYSMVVMHVAFSAIILHLIYSPSTSTYFWVGKST